MEDSAAAAAAASDERNPLPFYCESTGRRTKLITWNEGPVHKTEMLFD